MKPHQCERINNWTSQACWTSEESEHKDRTPGRAGWRNMTALQATMVNDEPSAQWKHPGGFNSTQNDTPNSGRRALKVFKDHEPLQCCFHLE